MTGVFITGATGNVGARIVQQYLSHSEHDVFVLVRGDSRAHAEQRMEDVLRFWDCPPETYRGRLTVLCGDVLEPDLGLSPEEVSALADRIDLVIHAASNIRLDLTLEQARRSILGAARNAWNLSCKWPGVRRFGFVSTLEVVGAHPGLVREEFLTHYGQGFFNTYELAKYEAEEFLRQRIEGGGQVTVFRPSMVVGDSRTGKALAFQSFYLMAEKMLLEPDYLILPKGPPVDTIPIDVLARGIVGLMEYAPANGQVYHLSQGIEDRLEFADFIEKVRAVAEAQLGRTLRRPWFVHAAFHRAILAVFAVFAWGKLARTVRMQRTFLALSSATWRVESRITREALQALGIAWPPFEQYLPVLMRHYFERRQKNTSPAEYI